MFELLVVVAAAVMLNILELIMEIVPNYPTKSLVTLIMLVSWEIWNERNARVFRNIAMLPSIVVEKIRGEAALWSLAGAKNFFKHKALGPALN
jgi:hypothetical protein